MCSVSIEYRKSQTLYVCRYIDTIQCNGTDFILDSGVTGREMVHEMAKLYTRKPINRSNLATNMPLHNEHQDVLTKT